MIKAISRLYCFSHMWKKVENYMSRCDLCHKVKSLRYKPYREMRTALVSDWPWASIAMNFIINLLSSKKLLTEVTYNSILLIVDQLIKKVWFLLYKKVSDTEELMYKFLWHIIAL